MRNKPQIGLYKEASDRTYSVFLAAFLLLFAFLLVFHVNKNPVPYHTDEAGMAYDAKNLASFGTDRWGYHYPVYFINYGGGQSALYMYLAVFAIKLFGFSTLTVRLPAIILSLASAFVFALLIRINYGSTASLIAAAIFCLQPFSIMHSRWGLDAYLLFPMLIFSCAALFRAVRTEKKRWFICAGCLFGITLYSYAVSYILIPFFLITVTVCLLLLRKIRLKNLIALALPLTAAAVPLLLLLAVNNGLIEEIRTDFFSVPKLFSYRGSEFSLSNISKNLEIGDNNIFYNILINDKLIYNIIPRFGALYYFTLPILLYGMILSIKDCTESIREKRFSCSILMCFLFLTVFIIQLLLPYSNANRACAIYFPLIYFIVIGTVNLSQKFKYTGIIFSCILLIMSFSFLYYYFRMFPRDLSQELSVTSISDLQKALKFAKQENSGSEPLTIYGLSQPYLYILLAENIDASEFAVSKEMDGLNVVSFGNYRFEPGEVSADRIYLLRTDGWVPLEIREIDFKVKSFGTVTVYYP